MPDTSFYIENDSRKLLFDYISSIGGQIIPDLHYEKPEFKFIESNEEFLNYIDSKTVRFFIISNKFKEQELVMSKNRYLEKPTYHIVQRLGGPYIDLALYRSFSENATVKYKRTDIGYYAKFLDRNDLSIEYKTNSEIKKFYSEIIKYLKSICSVKTISNKKYYIDKNIFF